MTIKKTTLCLAVTATLLSGCASTYQASPSYSEALNVIKAAGMDDGGFKDMPAPKDTSTRAGDSAGGALYNATMAYQTGGPGMTNAQAGAASLAISLIDPGSKAKKPHIIAWVPTSSNGTPQDTLIATMMTAGKKTLHESGYDVIESKSTVKKKDMAFSEATIGNIVFSKVGTGCSVASPCEMFFGVFDGHETGEAPKGIRGVSGNVSYVKNEPASFLGFTNRAPMINEVMILRDFSKNLPSWAYLYVSPNTFVTDKGEKLPIPMMLNSGREIYFVR